MPPTVRNRDRCISFFYYPSEEYISHIMREDRLMFVDEIETADLFPGEDVRERIMVFEVAM